MMEKITHTGDIQLWRVCMINLEKERVFYQLCHLSLAIPALSLAVPALSLAVPALSLSIHALSLAVPGIYDILSLSLVCPSVYSLYIS